MNFKQQVAISKIVEHPENKKLFKDIKETSPTFWEQFKDSIKEVGILEPLIVNEISMQVRSGNQRLKAALELGIETVPVIFVEDETTDDEVSKMIASNVFRRTIDPFSMFEYIGRLRKGSYGKSGNRLVSKMTANATDISSASQKTTIFVYASDIFNTLPGDQQTRVRQKGRLLEVTVPYKVIMGNNMKNIFFQKRMLLKYQKHLSIFEYIGRLRKKNPGSNSKEIRPLAQKIVFLLLPIF